MSVKLEVTVLVKKADGTPVGPYISVIANTGSEALAQIAATIQQRIDALNAQDLVDAKSQVNS